MKKRFLAMVLAVCMLVSVFPAVPAAAADTSGQCGDNVYWEFDEATGTLTISGTGAMKDYPSAPSSRPWHSFRNLIKAASIGNGVTSIGNNSKNTIVLFKDKLIAPHHCDIRQEGSKYVIIDAGTPMGTVVNGQKTNRHVLRQGDAIAIGNSVLVFNVK